MSGSPPQRHAVDRHKKKKGSGASGAEGDHRLRHQRIRAGGGRRDPRDGFLAEWMENVWQGQRQSQQRPGPTIKDWRFDTSSIGVPSLVCASFPMGFAHLGHLRRLHPAFTVNTESAHSHRRRKWGAYYGPNETELQKRFLDRFLKDHAAAMDGVPRVRLKSLGPGSPHQGDRSACPGPSRRPTQTCTSTPELPR